MYCVAIMVAAFILQAVQSSLLVRIRLQIGVATDRRIGLVTKLIQGIQTIKNYVWEEPIVKHIKQARRVECRRYLNLYCLKGFSEGFFRNSNIFLTFPIVLIPLAQGKTLEASSVFTALTLIDSITFNIVQRVNLGANVAAEYFSVIKRAQDILLLKEKRNEAQ